MSFKKTVISTVAAAVVATSAFAAVTVNQDGKGEYLNFPAYYATTDGWSTNLRVVNTNTTHAVVAKVVIREYATSQELLDFPIYLSPGDVWTADIVNNGSASSVKITSTDDSGPKPGQGLDQALFDKGPKGPGAGNNISYGYVEVLTLGKMSAADIAATDAAVTWSEYTPLPKATIKAAFENTANTWLPTESEVFGQQTITATTAGAERSMTLMATALDITMPGAMLWELAPTNVFASDTTPDSMWYSGVEAEIRTALKKDAVQVVNYVAAEGETQLLLTQPYKHTNDDANASNTGNVAPYFDNAAASNGYSFGKFYYTARAWDEQENTYVDPESVFSGGVTVTAAKACETEVCYLKTSDAGDYASGWTNYTLGTSADTKTFIGGVPTITTVITGIRVNGVGIVNMIPAANTPTAP